MISAVLLLSGMLVLGAPDTLQTASVSAERGISVSRKDTLKTFTSQSVTDLLIQCPGLVVGDYGGYAGIKSVNLRGLGSPCTEIYIDGIRMRNVQTGQPDLSIQNLNNFSGAQIDYAQNSINFSTARPTFNKNKVAGKVAFSGGSFGTFLPLGRLDWRISDKIALSVNASGTISKGNFPYADGLRRTNNDFHLFSTGLDLFGTLTGGEWMVKTCYNGAERGTPGSTDWPSKDRQKDRSAFAQGLLRKSFSAIYSMSIAGKAAYDNVNYVSEWGDSDYKQSDFQLNTSHRFHVNNWLSLSAVAEFEHIGLTATDYNASRNAITAIAGAAVQLHRFNANATLQYEGTFDQGGAGRGALSPSASLRLNVLDGLDIVAFARRAYRMPTFNELYYPGYGNPDLKPEDAWLTDIGIDYRREIGNKWAVKAKLDGFYNHLTNKITSAPTPENPSIWLPYNIGEVRSVGFDADASFTYSSGAWKAGASARYSFQNAENVPYLSKNTVVIGGNASYKDWTLNTVWNYRGGRKDSYGAMPDWNTLDLIAGKTLNLKACSIVLKLTCRNIADQRYELVTGYPMPGRSVLGGVELLF